MVQRHKKREGGRGAPPSTTVGTGGCVHDYYQATLHVLAHSYYHSLRRRVSATGTNNLYSATKPDARRRRFSTASRSKEEASRGTARCVGYTTVINQHNPLADSFESKMIDDSKSGNTPSFENSIQVHSFSSLSTVSAKHTTLRTYTGNRATHDGG